jgi:hypothetical protein
MSNVESRMLKVKNSCQILNAISLILPFQIWVIQHFCVQHFGPCSGGGGDRRAQVEVGVGGHGDMVWMRVGIGDRGKWG